MLRPRSDHGITSSRSRVYRRELYTAPHSRVRCRRRSAHTAPCDRLVTYEGRQGRQGRRAVRLDSLNGNWCSTFHRHRGIASGTDALRREDTARLMSTVSVCRVVPPSPLFSFILLRPCLACRHALFAPDTDRPTNENARLRDAALASKMVQISSTFDRSPIREQRALTSNESAKCRSTISLVSFSLASLDRGAKWHEDAISRDLSGSLSALRSPSTRARVYVSVRFCRSSGSRSNRGTRTAERLEPLRSPEPRRLAASALALVLRSCHWAWPLVGLNLALREVPRHVPVGKPSAVISMQRTETRTRRSLERSIIKTPLPLYVIRGVIGISDVDDVASWRQRRGRNTEMQEFRSK